MVSSAAGARVEPRSLPGEDGSRRPAARRAALVPRPLRGVALRHGRHRRARRGAERQPPRLRAPARRPGRPGGKAALLRAHLQPAPVRVLRRRDVPDRSRPGIRRQVSRGPPRGPGGSVARGDPGQAHADPRRRGARGHVPVPRLLERTRRRRSRARRRAAPDAPRHRQGPDAGAAAHRGQRRGRRRGLAAEAPRPAAQVPPLLTPPAGRHRADLRGPLARLAGPLEQRRHPLPGARAAKQAGAGPGRRVVPARADKARRIHAEPGGALDRRRPLRGQGARGPDAARAGRRRGRDPAARGGARPLPRGLPERGSLRRMGPRRARSPARGRRAGAARADGAAPRGRRPSGRDRLRPPPGEHGAARSAAAPRAR